MAGGGEYNQEPARPQDRFLLQRTTGCRAKPRSRRTRPCSPSQECRIRTVWVRYYDDGMIEFQVAVIPHDGKQRLYIRSNTDLTEEQRAASVEVKNAFGSDG